MTTIIECRCGDVKVALSEQPLAQFYCHCDDCQVVHGAAYVPESLYHASAVNVLEGQPNHWKLKHNPRVSCARCGTRVFVDVLSLKLRGVNGYLLPAGSFRPSFHMQCRFAVRPIVDELPHYKKMPPEFGGSDELIGW